MRTLQAARAIVALSPFENGVLLAFNAPQFGDCIRLFTVTLYATTEETDVVLQVTRHEPPTNPNRDCPSANPWDPPVWGGGQCVGGGALFVNSLEECLVAVKRITWSQVKARLGR